MPVSTKSSFKRANRTVKQFWPVDRKIDLVLEGLRGRRPVAELCREFGISPARYYQWRQQVLDAARTGLTYPETEQGVLEERVRQLEAENAILRARVRIFQDLSMAD